MSLKKRVLQAGAVVALSGLFAFSTQTDVEASSWQPRTVSEIEAEIDSQLANEDSAEYTFKAGDTLWGISEATDIPVNKLAQINDIENSSMIVVGNSIHLSSNKDVVSVEKGNQVESYDVSKDNVEKTETPQEVEQEAAQDNNAEAQASEQRAAEQAAAEQRSAEQEAAEQRAAEQAAADQRAAEAEENQDQSETRTLGASADLGGSEAAAKAEIADRESGGSGGYSARNGQYIGKYQLTNTYLNGDYSPENQERTADAYVNSRYGSWTNALSFWNQNGWY